MSRSSHDAGHYCETTGEWVYFRAPDGGAAICPVCKKEVESQPPTNLEGKVVEFGQTTTIRREKEVF